MLKLIRNFLFKETFDDPLDPWETQDEVAERRQLHKSQPAEEPVRSAGNYDVSDPSCRGGILGSENEMPDGGDSTRGMSKGPASKSPMPDGTYL